MRRCVGASVHCPLPTAHCLPPTAHCPPPTAHRRTVSLSLIRLRCLDDGRKWGCLGATADGPPTDRPLEPSASVDGAEALVLADHGSQSLAHNYGHVGERAMFGICHITTGNGGVEPMQRFLQFPIGIRELAQKMGSSAESVGKCSLPTYRESTKQFDEA